ncbi:hypothetical protein H9Q70_000966 [Fusarium xylarioides]|nr:hypothetical protein H9Q70_000966 [Fusarium xylarioides]
MSESGSASGSSSDDEVPSPRASVQHQDENDVEQVESTENKKEQDEERDKNVGDDAQNLGHIISTEAETKNESLHLVRQELPSDSDTSDQATEARLIDCVVIPGVYGNWTDKDFGPSPGSGSSAWVTKFAEKGWESPKNPQNSCRVFRFDHDIGGAVVKDALITAFLDRSSWQDISEMTRVLIFNGCLHRQRDTTDLETRLASFLYANYSQASGKSRPLAPSISGLAKAIIQVNGLFITSHIALRSWIINLHSYGENSNGGFDAYCATLGMPLEKTLTAPTETDYSPLTQYLAKLEPERKLLALASPIYPLRNKVEPNPLADLPDYQAWLNSPCPQILYLHGSHRVRDVAERVFYALEDEATRVKRRANVLYFSFDRFDVRADSIRDMIATFLAQICNHHPRLGPAINRLCSQIENEKGWTETDLIQFFEMFRISAEVEQIMIVINHFDECSQGSRKRFLDHIANKYYNDETPWKIVVTSHEPDALSGELSGPFCVPIDISSEKLGDLAVDSFETDIQALMSSRGDLNFREEQIHTELGFTEKLDPAVRHILKYPDQDSLERLISWLLYAVRPLTIWELATIITFSDERERTQVSPSFMAVNRLVEKIKKDFASILEVNHNEVRFKHPCLHEVMVNSDPSTQNAEAKDYLWNTIKGKAHHVIQNMCIDYLSRDAVQEYVRETFAVSLFPIFAGLGLHNVVEPLGSDDALRGLIKVASKGQKQVVEDLLSEYDFTLNETWDVLKASCSSGSEELMNALLDKIEAKGKIPDNFEWPPVLIYQAANLGLEGFAERILSLGCPTDLDVDWRNEKSMQVSPVYQAACHGYTNTVQVLLKHGASIEYTSLSRRNPLHKAALESHTETVKAILEESQVNIDCPSDSNFTPLYLAVLGGNHDTVKLLLEKGADPNMATDDGFMKCIRLLLENGANPNIPGPSGPPLHWAVAHGRIDVFDMLLEASADPQSEVLEKPLLVTSVGSELEETGLNMLKRLLELKLDVNCKDGEGSTPLTTLIRSYENKPADEYVQRDKALRMLIDHGADVSLPNDDMWTPLQYAVIMKQYNAV